RDHRAVDIDLSGTVHGVLDFPRAQHEGIAFDGQGNLHIVGEPNRHSLYSIP
ncbi:MAG: SdiA-regulated domain-containing protein, partial [Kofleriaceae bacterium]|nr:SdiA-regulated domain-containing protein [Kofleriaceae bacterium]